MGYPVTYLPFAVGAVCVAWVFGAAPEPRQLPGVISILALLAGYVWFSEAP